MPTDVSLQKTEKNDVLELIVAKGFKPSDFEWSEGKSTEQARRVVLDFKISVLTHKNSQYHIMFGGFRTEISPGINFKVESHEHNGQWGFRLSYCGLWLDALRREVDAPDLWAMAGQQKTLSEGATSDLENRAFTEQERAKLLEGIEELRSAVLGVQIYQAEQTAFIEEQFKYLKDSSGRLGRKDWINVAFSIVINLATSLALDPIKAQGILALGGVLFQWIWRGTQGLLAQ